MFNSGLRRFEPYESRSRLIVNNHALMPGLVYKKKEPAIPGKPSDLCFNHLDPFTLKKLAYRLAYFLLVRAKHASSRYRWVFIQKKLGRDTTGDTDRL